MLPITREGMWRRHNPKANMNRESSLLRHQLCSTPFLVQATGMFQYKAMNNTCMYVPIGGVTAEEVLVEIEMTRYQ
jgi:hypothetical protein